VRRAPRRVALKAPTKTDNKRISTVKNN
jgi:hypothetical protein